jgi:uncharacterized protein YegP (UPF0339 family)
VSAARLTLAVYRDAAGEWRWRLKARNGRVLGDSGEGYTRRASAVRAAKGAVRAMREAWLEVAAA